MRAKLELKGKVFNRLEVIKEDSQRSASGDIKWVCKCTCGDKVSVIGSNLRNGNTGSCGCLSLDTLHERNTTHGLSKDPLYLTYRGMLNRCLDKKHVSYKNYGGRCITICDYWLVSVDNFIKDMTVGYKEGLELDRRDNNKGYSKENCRWATHSENMRNRRGLLGTSKYKGVSKNKGKYRARVKVNGKERSLGVFTCEVQAALAYNKAASKLFGEYAYLNIIEE